MKKEKDNKSFKQFITIFLIIFALSIVLGLCILNSIYKKQYHSYVNSLNASAEKHYKIFEVSSNFIDIITITDKGALVIYGDRSKDGSYIVHKKT